MPFNKTSPSVLNERIQPEINAASPNGDSQLRNSVEGVLARTLAMASYEMTGFIEYVADQILVTTADEEHLARHATKWGIERKSPTAATGKAQFTGTNGITIPENAILQRADGTEYEVMADAVVTGGVASVTVKAVATGSAGNAPVGAKLSLTSPIAGVISEGLIADDGSGGGLTAGNDIENVELWRGRILDRIQFPAHGGAKKDYEKWAKEVPGVTRAWPYPLHDGVGSVALAFVMDNKVGTIIPSAGEVVLVQEHLEEVRPVTADVTVFAPTPSVINFTIQLNPNSAAVQTAIQAELQAFFKREAIPGGTLRISRIREVISAAAGEFDHVLTSPNANIVSDFGHMPVLGAFTWSALA